MSELSRRRTLRHAAIGLAAWTVIGVLCAGELIMFGRWSVYSGSLLAALTVVPAAVLSIPVWVMSSRRPWSELPALRAFAAHTVTAIVFGGVFVSAQIAAATALGATSILEFLHSAMGVGALVGLTVYGLVVGVSVAVRSQAALAEERAARSAQQLSAAEARSALTAAELATIRARLNPHFLFNALHSISALVRRDGAAADAAIEELGLILRGAIADSPSEVAPLHDEMELSHAYLTFERRRLGDRLRVDIDVDDEAAEVHVPRLVVQPLLENAIRHGVERTDRTVTLTVRARRCGRDLLLTVADDGPGCDGVDWDGAGIGLVGLRRRLALLHDGRARVDVTARTGSGFHVDVRLPVA